MAREVKEIKEDIMNAIAADENLVVLNSTSVVSLTGFFAYVFAFAANVLEKLYDALVTEVEDLLAKLMPHTSRWYATKLKAFQYGFSLVPETDKYDNSGFSTDQIEASKIVKYVAVVPLETVLRIKVAGEMGGELTPFGDTEKSAILAYIGQVKDAGVRVQLDSLPPDAIRAKLLIYYDPLVLNSVGSRLDGSDLEPVQTAFKNYLKNLPFNGYLVTEYMIDALQKVQGVVVPHLVSCEVRFGELEFQTISAIYNPDAGYLRLENESDLELEFIPQSPLM